MEIVMVFAGGVQVTDEDGSILAEYGDEPLEIVRDRLVPPRCRRGAARLGTPF